MITQKYFLKGSIAVLLLTALSTSCKKFLDVGTPKVEITSDVVFADNNTATNALIGIYGDMMSNVNAVSLYNALYLGLSADELVGFGSVGGAPGKYYFNTLDPSVDDFWSTGYKYIYRANAVIEGAARSTKISDSTRTLLNGESLFIRAFSHFYLVNLFGDVPYITSTDYRINNLALREPVAVVYQKIITDLLLAHNQVKEYYPDANNNAYSPFVQAERVRPNKSVVAAMLARVYLYTGNWAQAEKEASSVIAKKDVYALMADLNAVFLKNSTETIWQLMPSSPTLVNGYFGNNFILVAPPNSSSTVLSSQLWNAFEAGDKRKTSWVGTFVGPTGTFRYAFKYKERTTTSFGPPVATATVVAKEYNMIFRLAEQYLIRAEARANQNNISGAVADLNLLRARARDNSIPGALPDYLPSISQADCLLAIAHERQVELFTESGHRWLDLKRTGKANEVLGITKGLNWQPTDQLLPIPKTQLDFDPNMTGMQNPGYN